MRDLLLVAIVAALTPVCFVRPWIGTMAWTWVSLMYPHRLAYGFAQDLSVAAILGGATLAGFVFMKAEREVPTGPIPTVLLLFIIWMCVTSLFAIYPGEIGTMFAKVMKIQLMVFVTMALLHDRRQLETYVWVIVGSLGFYGVKGGLFTLRTGGGWHVEGPAGSFIAGNTEVGLALVVAMPLMYYGATVASNIWARRGFLVMTVLTAAAVLGTQSRGAMLAIAAATAFLWLQNAQKLRNALLLGAAAISLVVFMPDSWTNRMGTIKTYDQDTSATGRINAWVMAWNLAVARPIGGGFEVITPELFQRYAPDPLDLHAAHSIYFQVLGEHGFLGLFLFLLIWWYGWRTASWIRSRAAPFDDLVWVVRLAGMVQVSLVAYLVGGAFLSLAYFDLPYDLLVILVVLRRIVQKRLAAQTQDAATARGFNDRANINGASPETNLARR